MTIKNFWCSHSTTIDIGRIIRVSGFKPSSESFRVCQGTYFWNDEIELLGILAEHWYECKKQWNNKGSKNSVYPEKDIIYAIVSCEESYIIDLTHPNIRMAFIKLAEKMQELNIKNKHLIYASLLHDLEEKVAKRLGNVAFQFKVVLAIEAIPKIPNSFITMQINSAKILVVRDNNEELIAIKDPFIAI